MDRPTDRILPAVALTVAFCAVAPFIDLFSKLAGQTLSAAQIAVARYLVQGALMYPLVAATTCDWRVPGRLTGLLVLRAASALAFTGFLVAGLAVMPLADAVAIVYVEPFILMLLAWLLFGERVGPRRLAAAGVGLAGAMLVVRPGLGMFGAAALYPLAAAFFFAVYVLSTRALGAAMHPVPMQAHTAGIAVVLGLPVLVLAQGSGIGALESAWPEGRAWLWLAGLGVAATISHLFMTWALRLAPSATLAPLFYLELPVTVALGYLVLDEFPRPLTWAGIAVIAGSGLYVIHRERLAALAARPRGPAPPAPPAGPRPAG
ncbi:MAG: DMT family transporter [Rhodobacteraceae bacterium]|nr:DMT family transporter [Paracoccaceae bacterium]